MTFIVFLAYKALNHCWLCGRKVGKNEVLTEFDKIRTSVYFYVYLHPFSFSFFICLFTCVFILSSFFLSLLRFYLFIYFIYLFTYLLTHCTYLPRNTSSVNQLRTFSRQNIEWTTPTSHTSIICVIQRTVDASIISVFGHHNWHILSTVRSRKTKERNSG